MRPLLYLAPLVASCPVFAGISDNFDTTIGNLIQEGAAPGPSIVNVGGANGNVLHLLNDTSNGQSNRYLYNLTDSGAYDTVNSSFQFRITSIDQGADGIHFALLPTSVYGTTGGLAAALPAIAEEPNIPGAIAFGIDVYDGAANDVSAHWNGSEIINTRPATSLINLDNGQFHTAAIQLQRVGNSMNATVTVTPNGGAPVTLINHVLPMAQPYENRAEFAGRTGGLNMSVDIDDVSVQYSNPYSAPANAGATGLLQDFDRLGTTNFTAVQQNQLNGPAYVPGPRMMPAEAGSTGAFIRISQDGSGSNSNRIATDRALDGGTAFAQSVQFDFRSTSPDQPADGFGFLLLPTSIEGRTGNGPSSSEEPNHAGTLAVGFDTYPNNGAENGNQVTLHWNGAVVGTSNVAPGTINLNAGVFHQSRIDMQQVPGGSNVSLTLIPNVNGTPGAPVQVFSNHFVAGMVPYDYRVGFSARTGGADASVDIDNIMSLNASTGSGLALTQGFDGTGSYFKTADVNTTATSHPAITSGGPDGNFLRLSNALNGESATVGFDQNIPDGWAKPSVTADFDFRMTADNIGGGVQRADGFGFGLFDTGSYGTSGIVSTSAISWEDANVTGALLVGFDIYDGNLATTEDQLHVSYNGVRIADVPFSAFDLNSDSFHHAEISLLDNGADTLLTLTLTPDSLTAAGAPVVAISGLNIPGLDLDAFDFRAGFGARTGGLNTVVDLDNIVVVPEPSSALLGAGALGLLLRRRRRA